MCPSNLLDEKIYCINQGDKMLSIWPQRVYLIFGMCYDWEYKHDCHNPMFIAYISRYDGAHQCTTLKCKLNLCKNYNAPPALLNVFG